MRAVLEEARQLGFLGAGPVETHVAHARGFDEALATAGPLRAGPICDLGSGGGVPGLVLAELMPHHPFVLLDGSRRRAAWLADAVTRCGFSGRVSVVAVRAEEAGHDPAYRGRFPAVVARSFAIPPVTAECAAALLEPGGVLVVSEPPVGGDERWPLAPLATLGLRPEPVLVTAAGRFRVVRMVGSCPERYPRRTGVPAKRPIYRVPATGSPFSDGPGTDPADGEGRVGGPG